MKEIKKNYVLKTSASGKFRLAKISKLTNINIKDTGKPHFEFKTLSYEEGINIEKRGIKEDNANDFYYYVIGTVRPDGRGNTNYEDCDFRTFNNVRTDEFDEFKELVLFADNYLNELLKNK